MDGPQSIWCTNLQIVIESFVGLLILWISLLPDNDNIFYLNLNVVLTQTNLD
jgi:hypothetical protein